jgi:hypothetical protein
MSLTVNAIARRLRVSSIRGIRSPSNDLGDSIVLHRTLGPCATLTFTYIRSGNGISRKDGIQLLSNIVSVEDFHALNFPVHYVENNRSVVGCQHHIPMTGTEAILRLRLRIKRGAEAVPAAAAVKNHQSRHLCSKFGFAFLGQELMKLSCKRGERVGEWQLFFGLLVHGVSVRCCARRLRRKCLDEDISDSTVPTKEAHSQLRCESLGCL